MLTSVVKEKIKRYYFYAFPKIHTRFIRLLKWREDKKLSEKFREVELSYLKEHENKES